MAETTNAPSTGARKPAAKRTAPAKAAPKKITPTPTAASAETNAVAFALEPLAPTKRWAKFGFPEGSGCVGTVYAPLGTKVVKVRLES